MDAWHELAHGPVGGASLAGQPADGRRSTLLKVGKYEARTGGTTGWPQSDSEKDPLRTFRVSRGPA